MNKQLRKACAYHKFFARITQFSNEITHLSMNVLRQSQTAFNKMLFSLKRNISKTGKLRFYEEITQPHLCCGKIKTAFYCSRKLSGLFLLDQAKRKK